MSKEKGNTIEKEKVEVDAKLQPAKQWKLLIHNNPRTSFGAVMDVLMNGLQLNEEEANSVMLKAHYQERSIVLMGSRSFCETKLLIAQEYCKESAKHDLYGQGYEILTFSIEE